jgi:cutinase
MKSSVAASMALLATIAASSPVKPRLDLPGDEADDMQAAIDGTGSCAAVAALFARGTFDEGNIGVWVGPALMDAFRSGASSFAAQGVDASAYPADLNGYVNEGGSDSGAASMASTAAAYAQACPDSAIVFAGWSQGALVAHKALAQLDSDTLGKVAGLVTFGDMWPLYGGAADPIDSSTVQSFCVTGTVFDPLCAPLPDGFQWPTSLSDILGPFADLPSVTQGAEEAAAAADLVAHFPGELADALPGALSNLDQLQIQRLLLTPQHFTYGNIGDAASAASFALGLPAVQAAMSQ